MKEASQHGKSPIDFKRDSSGSFTVGQEGDVAICTIVLNDRMLLVTANAVYATHHADHIDPDRTDINVPNVVPQIIIAYGGDTPFISRTLLTGCELFDQTYLGQQFDKERALSFAFEAASNLAALTDIRKSIAEENDVVAKKLHGTSIGNSFELPATPNLRARGEAFIRHADITYQAAKGVSELFYPRKCANENWADHIGESLKSATTSNAQSERFLSATIRNINTARNFRNASEHPDQTKGVTFWDFELQPGLTVTYPSIEIKHPETPLSRVDLLLFMNDVINECICTFEGMSAFLCDENIKLSGPFDCQVVRRDEAKRGPNYTYRTTLKAGIRLPE